jgi:methylmalonyl-CoA mutase cobalamin-binding subunit
MSRNPASKLAIVATTPDDSHIWNLVGVQLKLEERGFEVRNLGACTPPELIAETVRDLRPDLLVISSINGHGAISMTALMTVLEQYQVKRATTIVAGGLLTTDPALSAKAEAQLTETGCAGVFVGEDAWERFDRFLARRAGKGRRLPPNDLWDPAAQAPLPPATLRKGLQVARRSARKTSQSKPAQRV